MPTRRSRQFCRALHQEIGDDPQRWTTVTAVADQLGVDQDKAMPVMPMTASDVDVWLNGTLEEALKLQKPQPNEAVSVRKDEKKNA